MKIKYDISEVNRCLLCLNPKCSEICPRKIDVGGILRSLYFENPEGALKKLGDKTCEGCDAPCEKSCVLSSKVPVSVKRVLTDLKNQKKSNSYSESTSNPDLSMDICGVKLENPFLLSSSVVASTYDMCSRAFEAGWAGVSFKTVCNFPQHETSPRFSAIHNHASSFCGFKNIEQLSDHSVSENMEIFRKLHRNYPTKVIVASIMGRNEAEWTWLAEECEKAGASVIECNFSCPNMENSTLGVTIGQSEELVEKFTGAVKRGTGLPVLAKLTPNVMDMVPMALAAKRGGADGIAAINTINSITGVNLNSFVAEPVVRGQTIVGGYSGHAVKPIALRFISDLSNCQELNGLHISGMGGIESWRDALEFILLGAGSVQITTSVMQYGYRIIDDLTDGLKNYLSSKGIVELRSLIGRAETSVVEHDCIERESVVFPVFNMERCNGCGRCYISCADGGHQAIEFDSQTRRPKLIGSKCVGCHLCRIVCPVRAVDKAAKPVYRKLDN